MAIGREADGRYVFLDYLRATAAWLVVWDHLANGMPGWDGWIFVPARWVRDNVAAPLGIIQDFGWFGVAVFFLISGFIISDRARVESAGEFVIKRVLRIYPMLAVAVLVSAVFEQNRGIVTPANLLANISLANYLAVPQVVLVGVAWSLVVEVMFYALTAVSQVARDNPHRIAFNLAVIALVIWRRGSFGPGFGLAAVSAGYLPLLVMGQTIYWWLARKRLSAAWGLGYLAAAYGLFLLGLKLMQPAYLAVNNSYPISVAYAVLLFLVAMRARLPELKVVRLLSDTSYSLYLMHGIAGFLLLKALIDRTPLWFAIGAAAAFSLAVSWTTFALIENPANRLARRLNRRWLRGAKTPAVA